MPEISVPLPTLSNMPGVVLLVGHMPAMLLCCGPGLRVRTLSLCRRHMLIYVPIPREGTH